MENNNNGNAGSSSAGTTPSKPVQKPVNGLRLIATNLLRGYETVIPDGSSLVVDGVTLTKQAVTAELQQTLDRYTQADVDLGQLKAARADLKQSLPAARQFAKGLKAAISSHLGSGSPQLGEFGIAAPKTRRKLTAAELALQVARNRNTRQLRHTLGKVQRAAIRSTGAAPVTIGPDGTMSPAGAPTAVGSSNGSGASQKP